MKQRYKEKTAKSKFGSQKRLKFGKFQTSMIKKRRKKGKREGGGGKILAKVTNVRNERIYG
jgi:hypothetical protein